MVVARHLILSLAVFVALASSDGFADGISTGHGTQIISLPKHVKSIAWNADQTRLAIIVSDDYVPFGGGALYIYDLVQGHLSDPPDTRPPVTRGPATFDATGRYVIVISPPETSGSSRGSNQQTLDENRDFVFALFPTETNDGIRYMRDPTIDAPAYQSPQNKLIPQVAAISLSSDGAELASVMYHSGAVALYDTHSWKPKGHLGPLTSIGDSTVDIAFLDTKNGILIGKGPTQVATWDIQTNKQICIFQPFRPDAATAMTYNPVAGTVIAGGGGMPGADDPFLEQVMRTSGGKLPFADKGMRYTPVRAWNPRTGQEVMAYTGPNVRVQSLAVSPDGHYLAATQGGGLLAANLLLWDARTGQLLGHIDFGPGVEVRASAFSPDSQRLAYSVDATVQIVDIGPTGFGKQEKTP